MTNPVTGLRAVARYTQIDVVWDAQPGAPWYWVRAKIAGRQVRWLTVCQPPTTGMVTLRNMDQGTDYTITIWAGPDGPGNNASVTCTTKGAKPAAPMASVSTTVPCPGQPPPPRTADHIGEAHSPFVVSPGWGCGRRRLPPCAASPPPAVL